MNNHLEHTDLKETQLKHATELLVHLWVSSKDNVDVEGHHAIGVLSTKWL